VGAQASQPVFIFLPMTQSDPNAEDVVVDPVCGRALSAGAIVGQLRHGGRRHYFCSLRCAEQFASDARASASP